MKNLVPSYKPPKLRVFFAALMTEEITRGPPYVLDSHPKKGRILVRKYPRQTAGNITPLSEVNVSICEWVKK